MAVLQNTITLDTPYIPYLRYSPQVMTYFVLACKKIFPLIYSTSLLHITRDL